MSPGPSSAPRRWWSGHRRADPIRADEIRPAPMMSVARAKAILTVRAVRGGTALWRWDPISATLCGAGDAEDSGAVLADEPAREADQDRRRSSATVATSRPKWPRSRCRDRCSSTFCRLSPACGQRLCRHDGRRDQIWHRNDGATSRKQSRVFWRSGGYGALPDTQPAIAVAQDAGRGDPRLQRTGIRENVGSIRKDALDNRQSP